MNKISCFVVAVLMSCSADLLAIDVVQFDTDYERDRYQYLAYELRCPKCQNQNLIDSNSEISIDLRMELARLIKEGKTDREIKEHMVSLYGDFILYRPPVQNNTLVLWAAPAVMAIAGLLVFGMIVWRRSRVAASERDGDSANVVDGTADDAAKIEDVEEREGLESSADTKDGQ